MTSRQFCGDWKSRDPKRIRELVERDWIDFARVDLCIVGGLTEALKLAVGHESSLIGRLLLVDVLDSSYRSVRTRRDPECALCGDEPSIERPTAVAVCREAGD